MNHVYKYFDSDRLGFLGDHLIRFTPPGALNDPYECLPSIPPELEAKALEKAKKQVFKLYAPLPTDNRSSRRIKRKTAERKWQLVHKDLLGGQDSFRDGFLEDAQRRMNTTLGILSLSTRWNSALMWSHYTRSYSGFCVGFHREHSFFGGADVYEDGGFPLTEVTYSTERLMMKESRLGPVDSVQLLLRKSTDWEYEKEVRKVAFLRNADHQIEAQPFNIALFKIPSDAISELIIGYRASPQVKREVVGAAKRLGVPCFETRVSRESFDVERVSL